MCGCLSSAPYWRPGLQPRHVLGINLATLWFAGWCSTVMPHQPAILDTFNISILILQTWQFHILVLVRFFVDSLGFSSKSIMSSVIKAFLFFFSIWTPLILKNNFRFTKWLQKFIYLSPIFFQFYHLTSVIHLSK